MVKGDDNLLLYEITVNYILRNHLYTNLVNRRLVGLARSLVALEIFPHIVSNLRFTAQTVTPIVAKGAG
jgi:hypothetical protein